MSLIALEIARNALTANRLAMDVAAQNVANANTPGYVRQRALLAPLANVTADAMHAGLGVAVVAVQQLRDQCLELQICHQEGELGHEQALAKSLSRIEGFFTDLDDSGIAAALGKTFDALQRLQTDPGSVLGREEVLFHAESFCNEMHEARQQLQQEKNILEDDLRQTVSQVNSLLERVAQLNARIVAASNDSQVNDLSVLREGAIRELSGLCGAVGLRQTNGNKDVLLGGVRLVQGTQVTPLSLVSDALEPARHSLAVGSVSDLDGLSGHVAGLIDIRDNRLASWSDHLDNMARTIADALNVAHGAGYDLNGQLGGAFLTYQVDSPASTLRVDQGLKANPQLLAVASSAGGVPGDGTNAAAMAQVRLNRMYSNGTQTAEEFHGSLLQEVGTATQRASQAVTARKALVQSLDSQYASQAGVSLDEEAVDIMRYQQAYNASIKLVQTALEMLDEVIALAH